MFGGTWFKMSRKVRGPLVMGVLLSCFFAGSAQGAQVGEITTYTAGLDPGARLAQIVAGPGGVWFSDDGSPAAIGRVAADGSIEEFTSGIAPAAKPGQLIQGPGGDVWFVDEGAAPAIGRVAPDGSITEFRAGLAPDSKPTSLTVGPDGNVWFTDEGAGAIGLITPAGAIAEFSAGLRAGSAPRQIITGTEGDMWFSDDAASPAVGRVDTSGAIQEFDEGLNEVVSFAGIAPAVGGGAWLPDSRTKIAAMAPVRAATVVRVLPGGAISESNPIGEYQFFEPPVTGPDGTVWTTHVGPFQAGIVWFTSDGVGHEKDYLTTTHPLSNLHNIGVDSGGNAWLFETGGPYFRRARLTEAGEYTDFGGLPGTDPQVWGQVHGPVSGPDGAMWFTSEGAGPGGVPSAISRIQALAPSGTGSVPPAPPVPVSGRTSRGSIVLSAKRLRLVRGRVAVRVRCTGRAACHGRLELSIRRATRGRRTVRIELAAATYSVPAGRSTTVHLKLSKLGRRLVRRARGGLRAEALVAASAFAPVRTAVLISR